MKENKRWRGAYNKIIFEQVDINEETIPNFIAEQINKAVLEERNRIIEFLMDWACGRECFCSSCKETLLNKINICQKK